MEDILLVGSNATGALENAYLRALRRLGTANVEIFDVSVFARELLGSHLVSRVLNRVVLSAMSQKQVGKSLLERLAKRGRDYDVVIVFKGAELSRRLLEKCRALMPRALWVNINPDDPLNVESRGSTNSNIVRSLSFFDLYCIWDEKLIEKLAAYGCRHVAYLPFGYDQNFHVPPTEVVPIESGVVSFVGAWDQTREALLSTLADCNLRIYGRGWDRVSRRSQLRDKVIPRNIYGPELAKIVSRSTVSLNLLRSQNMRAHNMRTFEIPAMGGLMLTTRTEGQQLFFPENEACLMYSDKAELRRKIDLVMQDPEGAKRIRRRGTELARSHSYMERARRLMELLSNAMGDR